MKISESTRLRIANATLELLLEMGIKKTSLENAACRAGVTRVTVYRHFSDKKGLVEAALMSIPAMIEGIKEELAQEDPADIRQGLDSLAAGFARLPGGDLPALLEETRRVYPELWQSFHQRRLEAIQAVFDLFFDRLERQAKLRAGLNRQVMQAFFTGTVVSVLESPSLLHLGLPAGEIFHTVKSIFLFGILQDL